MASLFGCGTLGDDGGGGSNLPNRGLSYMTEGWAVEAAAGLEVKEPSAVVFDGSLRLYFELVDGRQSTIYLDEPRTAILSGSAPSVVVHEGLLHMVFESQGRLLHTTSADGVQFEPPTDLLSGRSPSWVVVPDGFELYFESDRGIERVRLSSALEMSQAEVVLTAGVDCVDAAGASIACFDADKVGRPEVRYAVRATGRPVRRLLYTGSASGTDAIGFAAADPISPVDSEGFVRLAQNPVIELGSEPSNVVFGDHYLLFFTERTDEGQGIRRAISSFGRVSERF